MGSNQYGQLGDCHSGGEYTTVTQIVKVNQEGVINNHTIIQVHCGYTFTLFLDSMGIVYGPGLNNYGQLGDGTSTQRNLPVTTNMDGIIDVKKIVQISGGDHGLLLDSEGRVYGMGSSNYGQLGVKSSIKPILISNETFKIIRLFKLLVVMLTLFFSIH